MASRIVQDAIRLFVDAGYRVELSDNGHYKVFSLDGLWVYTLSSTTGSKRTLRNARTALRRLQRGDFSRVPGQAADARERSQETASGDPEQRGAGRVPSAYAPREKLPTAAAIAVAVPRASSWAPVQRDKSAANRARHRAREEEARKARERERLTATTECAGCGRPVRLMSARFSMVQAESRHVLKSWCRYAGLDSVPAKLEGLSGWNVPLFWCSDHAPESATEYTDLGAGVLDAGWLTIWTVTDPRSGQELRDMFEDHLLESLLPILTGRKRKEQ